MRIPEEVLSLGDKKIVKDLVYNTLEQFAAVVTMLWSKELRRVEVVLDPGCNS